MAIEVKVPSAGESISEVEIAEWLKAEGDTVQPDETLATLDTDKASVEVISPAGGVLSKILKQARETAQPGDVIAIIEDGAGASSSASNGAAAGAPSDTPPSQWSEGEASVSAGTVEHGAASGGESVAAQDETPGTQPAASGPEVTTGSTSNAVDGGAPSEVGGTAGGSTGGFVMPAAERILEQNHLDAASIAGSGPSGRVLKSDAQAAADKAQAAPPQAQPSNPQTQPAAPLQVLAAPAVAGEDEEIVPMTRLRQTIARHLVSAQQNAALLTTFNEIDMSAVMAMRKEIQDKFVAKHEVKLGFMSFFVKACIDALKLYPGVNAEIRGTDIVYRNHYDIGVAIGGGRGLVVPVLRRAERLSFAEIEKSISELAKRAKGNTLKPDELMGGTFTITNGGVYGSLLSTPIVNAPQSGILGMHAIQERPIAKAGQVVIAPMMYVALTYDHRIVDGREAVGFLVRVKDCIENPARMLLEV